MWRSLWSNNTQGEDYPGADGGNERMNDKDDRAPPKRQYPPFFEKAVPIALAIIAAAIVILLLIIVGVALGLFPGAG
jgi:hypothetical protein